MLALHAHVICVGFNCKRRKWKTPGGIWALIYIFHAVEVTSKAVESHCIAQLLFRLSCNYVRSMGVHHRTYWSENNSMFIPDIFYQVYVSIFPNFKWYFEIDVFTWCGI